MNPPYYSQGGSNCSSYSSYATPGSPPSLQFVAYNVDRIHQFEGNMSPLQHNRQRTQPLREWLYRNCQNPYPSKTDRDILAAQARMSGEQVAMWFANTRRRIKKIGMAAWSNGKYRDVDFHAKSLPSSSSSSSSRKSR
ncbi:putative iroquois-class homeodomain protein irx-1 [Sycon ciliatum]|uniref:putative iroquois-class homeodomain protein irx-1 n=1 Tax=Sycon ciliatum TaxID=27933 RepID=UPI0031F6D6A0